MRPNKTAEIRADLRRRILVGEWQPGDRLPSLSELSETYGAASRSAPTRALQDLIDEGLLTGVHGKGVYVRRRRVVHRDLLAGLQLEYRTALRGEVPDAGLFEAMTSTDPDDVQVTATHDWISASDQVAAALEMEPGDQVLLRTYRYVIDGAPHQIARSYLPAPIARRAGLPGSEQRGVGTIAHLHGIGITVDRAQIGLETRMPTADEVQQLEISRATPVYEQRRVLYRSCEPVELGTSVVPGDQVAYTFDIDLKEAR